MTKTHAIKTAAKWWADKLKQRQPHSNGDNSTSSVFACIFADMLTEKITDDQLTLFTAELESEIHNFMEKYNERHTLLSCDYGPGSMLQEAADKAGINYLNFPYKTHMHIERKGDSYTVEVRDGYGRDYERVMPCELLEEVDNG